MGAGAMAQCKSKGPRTRGTTDASSKVQRPGTWSTDVQKQEKCILLQGENIFIFPLNFCSCQALSQLDEAQPQQGRSSLLSPLTWMPILPRNILTDMPGNNALPTTYIFLNPVKPTPTIKHYLSFIWNTKILLLGGRGMVSIDKLAVANKVQNATEENEGTVKRLL